MTPPRDEMGVLLWICEVLDDLGIEYEIGGSIASSMHGDPRQTRDADLVVALSQEDVPALLARVGDSCYADEVQIRRALDAGRAFNLIHGETAYKLDFFPLGTSAYDQQEFRRRVPRTIGTNPVREVWFTSPEDIVLRKLAWYRLGGGISERQVRDVRGVLKVRGGDLDQEYLRHWAGELGVLDLLERALAEV